MSEHPPGTDISAADLDVEDVEENEDVPATSDPDSYSDEGTLGGLGGAEDTGGGAG